MSPLATSAADDVERAGAIFTMRLRRNACAVDRGDEIDVRAAETEDSGKMMTMTPSELSDEARRLGVGATPRARERVDGEPLPVAREGRARGVGDARGTHGRVPVAREKRAGETRDAFSLLRLRVVYRTVYG